jgi:hypothetical protein
MGAPVALGFVELETRGKVGDSRARGEKGGYAGAVFDGLGAALALVYRERWSVSWGKGFER